MIGLSTSTASASWNIWRMNVVVFRRADSGEGAFHLMQGHPNAGPVRRGTGGKPVA